MTRHFPAIKEKLVLFLIFAVVIAALGTALLISKKVFTTLFVKPITQATLHTDMGDITFKFRQDTPRAVENFIRLSEQGLYDSTKIHRVVPDFLIEGGDPLTKFTSSRNQWGKGGPGYVFPDEIFANDKMVRGVVAMVNDGPNTNGSQFFILTKDAEWLNGKNTIFADVVAGMDVVDNIASVSVGVTGLPLTDITIKSVELK